MPSTLLRTRGSCVLVQQVEPSSSASFISIAHYALCFISALLVCRSSSSSSSSSFLRCSSSNSFVCRHLLLLLLFLLLLLHSSAPASTLSCHYFPLTLCYPFRLLFCAFCFQFSILFQSLTYLDHPLRLFLHPRHVFTCLLVRLKLCSRLASLPFPCSTTSKAPLFHALLLSYRFVKTTVSLSHFYSNSPDRHTITGSVRCRAASAAKPKSPPSFLIKIRSLSLPVTFRFGLGSRRHSVLGAQSVKSTERRRRRCRRSSN
jgi:hypothetical protein